MDVDEVAAFAEHLGCRRRRTGDRVGWYVDGQLVVRPDVEGTVLIRLGGAEREKFLAAHPDTFGVPPRWEAHMKMQATLAGDGDAIRAAITTAWRNQRRT